MLRHPRRLRPPRVRLCSARALLSRARERGRGPARARGHRGSQRVDVVGHLSTRHRLVRRRAGHRREERPPPCVHRAGLASGGLMTTFHDFTVKAIDGTQAKRLELLGQGAARRERRVQVRAHAAVHGARGATAQVREQGLHRPRLPLQRLRRTGAGHGERDPVVLPVDLRRDVPTVRQGPRERRRAGATLRLSHRRRREAEGRGRRDVELREVPRRQGGKRRGEVQPAGVPGGSGDSRPRSTARCADAAARGCAERECPRRDARQRLELPVGTRARVLREGAPEAHVKVRQVAPLVPDEPRFRARPPLEDAVEPREALPCPLGVGAEKPLHGAVDEDRLDVRVRGERSHQRPRASHVEIRGSRRRVPARPSEVVVADVRVAPGLVAAVRT